MSRSSPSTDPYPLPSLNSPPQHVGCMCSRSGSYIWCTCWGRFVFHRGYLHVLFCPTLVEVALCVRMRRSGLPWSARHGVTRTGENSDNGRQAP
eukprot:scaffold52681_cov37-Tisochrysis_lutea.AAC.6